MIRGAVGKVMWVGRATVFLVGLAVILALVLGVASAALGANGKPFLLGKTNLATAVTTLVNQGVGPALSLRVESGPPLAVNSTAKVSGLNADTMDGADSSDFVRGQGSRVYGAKLEPITPGAQATLIETGAPELRVGITCPLDNGSPPGVLSITNTDARAPVELFMWEGYSGQSQYKKIATGQTLNAYTSTEANGYMYFSVLAHQGEKTTQIDTHVFNKVNWETGGNVDSCQASAQALELQR